jgi:hypothetical protein
VGAGLVRPYTGLRPGEPEKVELSQDEAAKSSGGPRSVAESSPQTVALARNLHAIPFAGASAHCET